MFFYNGNANPAAVEALNNIVNSEDELVTGQFNK
jgi:hypothetical protein